MPSGTRKRTTAQRRSQAEDDAKPAESVILDEQEQEAEITTMRVKNAADNERAQSMSDFGVMASLFISSSNLLRHFEVSIPLLTILSLLQTIIGPFSLTPRWLPIFGSTIARYHSLVVVAQWTIFIVAFSIARNSSMSVLEIARWAVPGLMSTAVEIQRRGERDAAQKLEVLDGLKYESKGA